MNTKHILIIGFVFLISLGGNKCYASHAMGADLTYTCLGGNQYKLRLSFYRDCSGIAAPANVTINISSASCGYSLSKTLNPKPGTGQEITPVCGSVNTTCNGGTYTGIREWIYEGTVTLPGQCVDWDFSYGLCCRNGAISTIVTPLSEQIYIHSTLNNVITPCNNSPTFMNLPVPFACTGQQFCYNHGAYDADGDSLAYSLMTPLGANGVPVTYIPPYSATQPMNSVPAMTFNPLTGDFCATPQTIEVTVMAVLVREYRNGILIGSVERDMQITVRPCTNMLPNLSGINGTGSFSDTICANQPYCFNVNSNDVDAGQNLTVTWDQSIPGITMTTAGAPHPVATFCWTPGTSSASLTPHTFTVKVKDDACPYLGIQIYSYSLYVTNITANAGPDQSVHCGGTANITATGTATIGSLSYLWSNGVTNASQSVGAGNYIVTVSNGTCSKTDTVNILLIPDITANFNATTVCANSPATFSDMSVAAAGSVVSWSWAFGDGTSSTLQNPSHVYSGPGPYNVCLISTNSLGCSDTVCKSVTLVTPPTASFLVNNDCQGIPLNFMNTSTPAGLSSYSWSFGNGSTSSLQNPVLAYPVAGVYPVSLIVTNALGCKDTLVQQVTAFPLPVANFNITGGGQCQGGQVSLADASTGIINNWSWSFGNGQTSTLQNPTLTYALPGPFNITLIVTSAKGCVDTITKSVTISMVFSAPAITTQNICPGKSATVTASGGVSYLWSNGLTTAAITVSPATTNTYTVTVTDSKGCTDTVPATVTIYPSVVLSISPAQSICIGQAATLSSGGASTYTWLPGGSSGQSINVSPAANTIYTVTGTDGNGCTATTSVNVTVNALPVVSLTSPVICPSSSVTLNAGNPGAGYLWSTGATNQTINVVTAGTYSVSVTNSFGCSATAQSVISASTLTANPQSLSACNGTVATFNAANPGKTYLWSNGATSQTISVGVAGSYTVTVSDASGCNISFTSALTVNPVPVPNFTNGLTCANIPVVFSNTSSITSGTITSYNWKFGDGNISSLQNPGHQYTAAGTFSVCLKVTSNNGCIDSICKTISVHAPPSAGFTVNNGCQGNALTLTNTSSPSGLSSYQWNFGNGTTSGAFSPLLTYTVAGNYNVSLIVADSYGCSDTLQNPVTAYPLPVVTATAVQPICSGQSAALSSGGASTYTWLPGGATGQTISVSPAANTNYTVTGTNVNGCTATAVVNVTVNVLPVITLTSPVICPASSALLNAGNPGANYLWSTGGTYQTLSVTTAGIYSVTVTNSFGCTASGQTTITASSLTANPQNLSVCNGTVATLNAGNPGNTYLWSNGFTSQTISVGVAKTYTVTVTDVYGCTLSFASALTVNPKPTVNFTTGPVCLNASTLFINTSSVSSGSLAGCTWNFGDGATSTQQNASHQYTAAGTYNVCLVVTTNNGCIDSIVKTITAHTPPSANFAINNGCQGNVINLTNASSPSGLTSYDWNFGNGGSSALQSPSLTYSSAGNYNVSLIVTDSIGCSDTLSNPVTIYSLPQVTIAPVQPICLGQAASLTASGAASYLWVPGSIGGASINVSPTASTNYLVTGIDTNGCVGTATVNLIVNPLPVVNLSNPVICPSSFVTLDAGNTGASYLWSTGASNQTITTSTVGNYSVTVTNSFGCTATGQSSVTASPLSPNSQTLSICNGTDATLNAANSGNTYHWSTGATSQSIPVSVAGAYTVTVTDVNGCTLSFASTLVVNASPAAKFSANAVCLNDITVFNNTSSVTSGTLKSYHWDFGDGNFSSDKNPQHLYSTPGTFIAILTVITDSGCTADTSRPVIVHPKPIAIFAPPVSCAGSSLIFADNSQVSTGSIVSYQWSFGDSSAASTIINPTHIYNNPGVYPVTLIVSSNFGCADTLSQQAFINPNPVAHFVFDKVNGCGPLAVNFTDLSHISIGAINSWQWNFGDGNTSAIQNPSHTYTSAGTFTVTLIATSGEGCSNSYTVPNAITVYPDPVAAFTPDPNQGGTVLQIITFENQSIGAINYQWDLGDGTHTQDLSPAHNYSRDGSYIVSLLVTNQYGCIDKASHEIIIVPTWTAYIPNAFTPDDDGRNDVFTVEGIGITNYNLKIFNRWGQMVFDADNRGWDGKHMNYGTMCKEDVYVYRVSFNVNIGSSEERTGQVTLMK